MKDPEKSRARSHEGYMKDPEKSRADIAAGSRKIYEKDLRRVAKMKLAWLYPTKVKNSCSHWRKNRRGEGGAGWATAPPTACHLPGGYSYQRLISN